MFLILYKINNKNIVNDTIRLGDFQWCLLINYFTGLCFAIGIPLGKT